MVHLLYLCTIKGYIIEKPHPKRTRRDREPAIRCRPERQTQQPQKNLELEMGPARIQMHLQIQMQSHPLGHTDTLISGQTSFKCRFYIDSLHCISKDSNSPWLFLSHFFFLHSKHLWPDKSHRTTTTLT